MLGSSDKHGQLWQCICVGFQYDGLEGLGALPMRGRTARWRIRCTVMGAMKAQGHTRLKIPTNPGYGHPIHCACSFGRRAR